MSSSANPEYRLRNLRRELKGMLMGRRLAVDPERTGVVELVDFGKRCDRLAALAAQSVEDLARSRCGCRIAEELELAARLAARMESLPRTSARVEQQCGVLEDVQQQIEAALANECRLDEEPIFLSLSTVARTERKLFEPFVTLRGTIADTPAAMIERGLIRRTLRRSLLDHDAGDFVLEVTPDGTLRFDGYEIHAEVSDTDDVAMPRSPNEPAEVKRALDMREGTDDAALRDFLLVKAVDEALAAVVAPHLQTPELVAKARALPAKPGKRIAIRPEAVARPVAGWDAGDALRAAEKLAARRLGPDWARLPKGAYVLRLFLSEDDALAADLLGLGPALRRMEKGDAVADTEEMAFRALRGLLGLLG